MPLAARVGDPTLHPGAVGPPGVPTVLICGQPDHPAPRGAHRHDWRLIK
jgi:hypothetical protein